MLPLALTALSAGVSVAGSVANYFGRQEQARRLRAETDEQLRRMKLANDRKLTDTRAAVGASGIIADGTGSMGYHLDAMTNEMRAEAEWAKKTGYQQATDLSKAANFGLLTDIGGAMFQFGSANNWWKK